MNRPTPIPDIITVRVPFRIVKRGGRKEIQAPADAPVPRRTDNTLIKALARADVPGLEHASGLFNFFDPNTKRAVFIHGGHWLAKPESPPGLEYSALFGRSSNQELLTGSDAIDIQPDDYVFLRPTQSEAIFLQFGDIAVFDGEKITTTWPTFPVSA